MKKWKISSLLLIDEYYIFALKEFRVLCFLEHVFRLLIFFNCTKRFFLTCAKYLFNFLLLSLILSLLNDSLLPCTFVWIYLMGRHYPFQCNNAIKSWNESCVTPHLLRVQYFLLLFLLMSTKSLLILKIERHRRKWRRLWRKRRRKRRKASSLFRKLMSDNSLFLWLGCIYKNL